MYKIIYMIDKLYMENLSHQSVSIPFYIDRQFVYYIDYFMRKRCLFSSFFAPYAKPGETNFHLSTHNTTYKEEFYETLNEST